MPSPPPATAGALAHCKSDARLKRLTRPFHEEKLRFLTEVCRIARSIIALAISRRAENEGKNAETQDFTNIALPCAVALTSACVEDLERVNIFVKNNKYIHPAARESPALYRRRR